MNKVELLLLFSALGMGLFIIASLWRLITLILAFYRWKKAYFRKTEHVLSSVISETLSSLISFSIISFLLFYLEIKSFKDYNLSFFQKLILEFCEIYSQNPPSFVNSLYPKFQSAITNLLVLNVSPDIRNKIIWNLFPTELIIFTVFFISFLTFIVLRSILKQISYSNFLKELFIVDEKMPEDSTRIVIYSPLFYLLVGSLLFLSGFFFLDHSFWPSQLNYYHNAGNIPFPIIFQSLDNIHENLVSALPVLVGQGLLAYHALDHLFYRYLNVWVFIFGYALLGSIVRSVQLSSPEEDIEEKENSKGFQSQRKYSSLNSFLKHIYEKYPILNKEEPESDLSIENPEKSFKKSKASPLFELPSIEGNEPILYQFPPNIKILGLNERYPDTVYQHRYQDLENSQHLIYYRILKILNLDVLYITQHKVFENLSLNHHVLLSTENLSGKTSIMLAAVFYEILQKKRTVLIIVPHDSVADEFNSTMIDRFESEAWFSSIHKLTLTSPDKVRMQQNITDRKPDFIFITPEMIHSEILNSPKAYSRFLEDLGLICFPDIQYFQSYEFIHSSFICMRLFFLIREISNKTRLQLEEKMEIPQNIFITISPLENALELCKSFLGKLVSLNEISEIRDSEAPSSTKRIFGFRAIQHPSRPDPYSLLPLTLAHEALSQNIGPVLLLGFRNRISSADKIRAASQMENSQVTRLDFEENVLIEEDFYRYKEKEVFKQHTGEMLKAPLIIFSGENDRLLSFPNLIRSIGILSQFPEILMIGIVTSPDQETFLRYVVNFWKEFEERDNKKFRIRREVPIPRYDSTIKELIKIHVLGSIKDQFSMESTHARKGLNRDEIREIFQIPNGLLTEILEELGIEGYVRHLEKKERLANKTKIVYLGYTYLNKTDRDQIQMTSLGQETMIPVVDNTNGRKCYAIDEFDRKTYFFPGTTHSINEHRYRIVSSSGRTVFVESNKTMIESRVQFRIMNLADILRELKESLDQEKLAKTDSHSEKESTFITKKYQISKSIKHQITTFNTVDSDSKKAYVTSKQLQTYKESLRNKDLQNQRIRVELKPENLINRNPFTDEILSIENFDHLFEKEFSFEEELDMFAIFFENTNVSDLESMNSFLPFLEEKLYSASEVILDNPRSQLIITVVPESLEEKNGILIIFIARALYNSNIFEIIEKDISMLNHSENSLFFQTLKFYSNYVESVTMNGGYINE